MPTVRLIAGHIDVSLANELVVVPPVPIVISIAGAKTRSVQLDGKPARLAGRDPGLLSLDMSRSTGYHRLVVDNSEFWFATEDAKLRLNGVLAMLAEMRTLGTGWGGQLLFSNGAGIRDPHVVYTWLDQHATAALDAIESILRSPRSRQETSRTLRRRGGGGVLVAPTLRLWRSDPQRFLSPSENGIVRTEAGSYDPLRVVARARRLTIDTIANRRAVRSLGLIAELAAEVAQSSDSTAAITQSRLWHNRAQALQLTPLGMKLSSSHFTHQPIQPEELSDSAYAESYRISRDLEGTFGWDATAQQSDRQSFVRYADEIYQAYVATVVAGAFTLTPTASVLGSKQPAYAGQELDLYYDSVPDSGLLPSWRTFSEVPDNSRPDLVLVDRSTSEVAVLDAKYRVGKDGHASEDSRKEVSAYMALYGLDSISIAYPATMPTIRRIAGSGNSIVELGIAPGTYDAGAIVNAVRATMQVPRYLKRL